MSSLREYLEKMSTAQLKSLLQAYCEGYGTLTAESILEVCGILADRDPRKPDPKTEFLRVCRQYLL